MTVWHLLCLRRNNIERSERSFTLRTYYYDIIYLATLHWTVKEHVRPTKIINETVPSDILNSLLIITIVSLYGWRWTDLQIIQVPNAFGILLLEQQKVTAGGPGNGDKKGHTKLVQITLTDKRT